MGALGAFLVALGAVPLAAMGAVSLLAGDEESMSIPPVLFFVPLSFLITGAVMAVISIRAALRRVADEDARRIAMMKADPRLHHTDARRLAKDR